MSILATCVLPRLSGDAGKFADHPAEGIDFDLACACGASQLQILRLLDPALADAEIRQFEQRIAVELLLGNRGDIADDMRRGLAERVLAGHAPIDREAGQFRNCDLDARHFVPTKIGADDDGHEGMFALDLAQDAAAVGLAHLDQRTERVERRRDIAGLLGDDDKVIILLVFGERDPEAIENSPAHRRYQPQADAVFVRENRIALRVHNLQLVHPPANGGEKQCLDRRRGSPHAW